MQLPSVLATDIRTYIKNLTGKDTLILHPDGQCLDSPNKDEIGTSLNLPTNISLRSEPIEIGGHQTQVVIPLKYNQETVGILLIKEKTTDIIAYTPLIKSFSELLIQQFYDNTKPVLDSTDQFIARLISCKDPTALESLEAEANVIGYQLNVSRLAVVVHFDGFWEKCVLSFGQPSFEREEIVKNCKRHIETTLNSFFTRDNNTIVAYIGSDRFAIFKAVEAKQQEEVIALLKRSYASIFEPLKQFKVSDIAVGIGDAHAGPRGLVETYRKANLALEFGSRLWGCNKSYYFGDLGLLSILGRGDRDEQIKFSRDLLSRLKNDDLIKTLECFFDQNLNLTETAEKMGIHRNTVIYRLNQISNILGSDPRIFDQAMTIKIALLIRNLFG